MRPRPCVVCVCCAYSCVCECEPNWCVCVPVIQDLSGPLAAWPLGPRQPREREWERSASRYHPSLCNPRGMVAGWSVTYHRREPTCRISCGIWAALAIEDAAVRELARVMFAVSCDALGETRAEIRGRWRRHLPAWNVLDVNELNVWKRSRRMRRICRAST